MSAILPIIILLFIIVVVIIINKKVSLTNGKYTYRLLLVYVVLLVVSVALYSFILPNEEPKTEGNIEEKPYLYLAASQGQIATIDEKYVQNSWEYEIENDPLEIQVPYFTTRGPQVFVERTNRTQSIKVDYYRTPTIINGEWEITDQLPLIEVDYQPSTLVIDQPNQVMLEYSGFKNEFPINQFKNGEEDGADFSFGEEVIYIHVPEQLDLDFNHDAVQLVEQ